MQPSIQVLLGENCPVWWIIVSSPLRWIYFAITRLRNACYDLKILRPIKLSAKVISVGNIEVGGTGKTPICIIVAKHILNNGGTPAILTRGYKSGMTSSEWCYVLNGQIHKDSIKVHPLLDEAMFQSLQMPTVPVVVGVRRAKAAAHFQNIYKEKITHWILDDGFQHRQIHRDLDLVLLNGERPFGNGFLLPTGTLREPPSSLRRASIILSSVEKGKAPQNILNIGPLPQSSFERSLSKIVLCSDESQHFPLENSAVAASAIARPLHFWVDLQTFGVNLVGGLGNQDHFPFTNDDLLRLTESADALIITEKDYARQRTLYNDFPKKVYLAKLEIKLTDAVLFDHIKAL